MPDAGPDGNVILGEARRHTHAKAHTAVVDFIKKSYDRRRPSALGYSSLIDYEDRFPRASIRAQPLRVRESGELQFVGKC